MMVDMKENQNNSDYSILTQHDAESFLSSPQSINLNKFETIDPAAAKFSLQARETYILMD